MKRQQFRLPEDVSWREMRDFICWLQKKRSLAHRTVSNVISRLFRY